MGRSFDFHLVNGRFGDPALYVRSLWERRALLFDIGDLHHLRPAQLLKISDVFVSHTHVDHFIGFDQLLRTVLNRDKTINIYGPEGLAANVAGKLAGYTWNLVEDYRLRLRVHEICRDRIGRTLFTCRRRFRDRRRMKPLPRNRLLLNDDRFEVSFAALDHSIPCLAFTLREKMRYGVNGDALRKLGWMPGPWLGRLKESLRRGGEAERVMEIPLAAGGRRRRTRLAVGEIARRIVIEEEGTSLAYVTDMLDTESNREKVLAIARGCDVFFCEAVFLERDADHALRKHHLTAGQAGRLARAVGAGRLEVFHFSAKYLGEEEALVAEARAAMKGETC